MRASAAASSREGAPHIDQPRRKPVMTAITFKRISPDEARIYQDKDHVGDIYRLRDILDPAKTYFENRLCTWLRLAQHFVGEGIGVEGETEERAESGVASFASVEAKDELVEVGLQMLAAQPVVDASCPSLEV